MDARASHSSVALMPVQDVDTIWPHCEAALERVRAKTGARWTPGYVLSRIKSSDAALFRFVEHGEHIAYMVVERLSGYEVVLNVWIFEGDAPGKERLMPIIGAIDDLARRVGASHWKLEGRKGWARALGKLMTGERVSLERRVA